MGFVHPHPEPKGNQEPSLSHKTRETKETLNAVGKYIKNKRGKTEYHINQYVLKEEIGRGSSGAVHRAIDQNGKEYALKEYSKSRLRKKALSNIIKKQLHERQGSGPITTGQEFPSYVHDIYKTQEGGDPLYFIKGEIEIMKRINHPNIVQLIEILSDPEEDSIYMVLEMCRKGAVMKVGIGERAHPIPMKICRHWFRDMISAIGYLHDHGIVHRDIKPDNLLLTENNALKVTDFGASEMFEKETDMVVSKSAGSLAFTPPELCVTKHGDVCGRAADIWSMGVSIFCLRFGHVPFEYSSVFELLEAIKSEQLRLEIDPNEEAEFYDLMMRLLEKDPHKRIKMNDLIIHPWVTKNGIDPFLPSKIKATKNSVHNEIKESLKIRYNNVPILTKIFMILEKLKEKFKSVFYAFIYFGEIRLFFFNDCKEIVDYKQIPNTESSSYGETSKNTKL